MSFRTIPTLSTWVTLRRKWEIPIKKSVLVIAHAHIYIESQLTTTNKNAYILYFCLRHWQKFAFRWHRDTRFHKSKGEARWNKNMRWMTEREASSSLSLCLLKLYIVEWKVDLICTIKRIWPSKPVFDRTFQKTAIPKTMMSSIRIWNTLYIYIYSPDVRDLRGLSTESDDKNMCQTLKTKYLGYGIQMCCCFVLVWSTRKHFFFKYERWYDLHHREECIGRNKKHFLMNKQRMTMTSMCHI